MGGYGTWGLILNISEFFAAAVPICGGGDMKLAQNVLNLPIWTFHAEDDPVVPAAKTREMADAIKKAGGSNIKYTEYPEDSLSGNPHNCWDITYANQDIADWMYSKVKVSFSQVQLENI